MNKLKSIFALKLNDVDYVDDIVSFELSSGDSDAGITTFSEYNKGSNRKWNLAVTGVFDGGSSGSLHDFLWNNAGSQGEFVIQPQAGISSPSNPQYRGVIRLPYRPDIKAEAGSNSTFDYEFELLGQPIKMKDGNQWDVFTDVFNEYF